MIGINNGCGTRNWQRIATLIAHLILVAALFAPGPVRAAAEKDYGKQGEPIELVIGYQPYYTQAWSGVIMRDKKFYEKYLPKGSSVSFQVGLQGAVEFGEFGPKDLVEEAPGGTNHESGAPLPMIAIGFESVASAQREKQPA